MPDGEARIRELVTPLVADGSISKDGAGRAVRYQVVQVDYHEAIG